MESNQPIEFNASGAGIAPGTRRVVEIKEIGSDVILTNSRHYIPTSVDYKRAHRWRKKYPPGALVVVEATGEYDDKFAQERDQYQHWIIVEEEVDHEIQV
jgi:hypothetical protein